jgi:hypothetical protein
MPWMSKWAGGFPLQLAEARGARVVDVDAHEYADLCLGDTGAMAGHSPPATVAAVRERLERSGGVTAMLPSEDAAWVGGELAWRFGLPQWQFTLTATDANRFDIHGIGTPPSRCCRASSCAARERGLAAAKRSRSSAISAVSADVIEGEARSSPDMGVRHGCQYAV